MRNLILICLSCVVLTGCWAIPKRETYPMATSLSREEVPLPKGAYRGTYENGDGTVAWITLYLRNSIVLGEGNFFTIASSWSCFTPIQYVGFNQETFYFQFFNDYDAVHRSDLEELLLIDDVTTFQKGCGSNIDNKQQFKLQFQDKETAIIQLRIGDKQRTVRLLATYDAGQEDRASSAMFNVTSVVLGGIFSAL